MAKKMMKGMVDKKWIDKKCKAMAFGMIVLGALILANVYWYLISWPAFIGWIFIVAGVAKLIMHKSHMM